jgi:hypothetical protein
LGGEVEVEREIDEILFGGVGGIVVFGDDVVGVGRGHGWLLLDWGEF